jgi:DNA-binding MarR family transcriptional regulator
LSSLSDAKERAGTLPAAPLDVDELGRRWSEELDGVAVETIMLAATVSRVAYYVRTASVEIARRHGVAIGDLRVLWALRRSGVAGALRPADLHRELMITSGAVSKQVDRLEQAGYVRRIGDPDLPRGLLIRLEDSGRQMAESAMRELSTACGGLERLPPDEARKTTKRLAKILKSIEGE